MKDLLLNALNESFKLLERQVKQTKKVVKYVNIDDVEPIKIADFMKKNNIPEDAYFSGKPNGYDGFSEICLCYEVDTATTPNEQTDFRRKRFNSMTFKIVFDSLTKNGYKRVGVPSHLFKNYADTTVYDMYINKEFDRILEYYSMYFVLI